MEHRSWGKLRQCPHWMTWEANSWAACEGSESSVRVSFREVGLLLGMTADRVACKCCLSKNYQITRKNFLTSTHPARCDETDSGKFTSPPMILGVLTGLRLEIAQLVVLLLLALLLCAGFFLVYRRDG